MSKFDDIKMPDNIDEVTKNAIRRKNNERNIRIYQRSM